MGIRCFAPPYTFISNWPFQFVHSPIGRTLRIYGTNRAVAQMGWNPYVRRVSPESAVRSMLGAERAGLLAGARAGGFSSLSSPSTAVGLGISYGINTYQFWIGEYDASHYAAAMIVDTGIVLTTAIIAGAVASGIAGSVVPGPGTAIGAAAGGAAAGLATAWLLNRFVREPLIEAVAQGLDPRSDPLPPNCVPGLGCISP